MGCCTSNTQINSIVEKFHYHQDKYFINYIENMLSLPDKNNKKDYSKLNDPINIVSNFFKTLFVKKFDDRILHFAIFHERKELVKYLIEKGANINLPNLRKKTPLDVAHSKRNKEILAILESL